jgi:hypothetical protein
MKNPLVSYRQGDVLIVLVADAPQEGKDLREGDDIVFMHGEVTGHAHRIVAPAQKARLFDVQAERYLRVLSEVTITHEEHGPILLREGNYRQAFQVEEQGEEVRRVAD